MYNMISNMRDSLGSAGVEAFIATLVIIIGVLVLACGVFQFLSYRKIGKLNDEIEKLKKSCFVGNAGMAQATESVAYDEPVVLADAGLEDVKQAEATDEGIALAAEVQDTDSQATEEQADDTTEEQQVEQYLDDEVENFISSLAIEEENTDNQASASQDEINIEQETEKINIPEFMDEVVTDDTMPAEEIPQNDTDSFDEKVEDNPEEEPISITEVPVSEVAEAAIEVAGDAVQSDDNQAGIVVTPDVKMDNDESDVMNFNMTTHSISSDTIEVPTEEFGKEYGVELEKLFGSADETDSSDIFNDTNSEKDEELLKEDRMRTMEHFSDTFHSGTDGAQEILEAVRRNDEASAEAEIQTESEARKVAEEQSYFADIDWKDNGADELSFDEKLKRALLDAEKVTDSGSENAITREELEKQIQI